MDGLRVHSHLTVRGDFKLCYYEILVRVFTGPPISFIKPEKCRCSINTLSIWLVPSVGVIVCL